MVGENRPWSEQYWEDAQDWVDKEAAASLLEDTKSAVMAQEIGKLGTGVPVNRAEQIVKAGGFWWELITKTVDARKEANLAKVKMEYTKMRANEWNNAEANHRAGTRL